MGFKNKKLITLVVLGLSFQFTNAFASHHYNEAFSRFSDWGEFTYISDTDNLNDDGKPDGVIDPGGGGQLFDTEYLFYKYDADKNILSIALQTGFDIADGHVVYKDKDYYAGDLALSFDGKDNPTQLGNAGSYEYAVDFGLYTKNGSGDEVGSSNGVDPAGFYKVDTWDSDITYSQSSPFAMDLSEEKIGDLITNTHNEEDNDGDLSGDSVAQTQKDGFNQSYWREVSFNLDSIVAEGEEFTVDAHWTMSCGNDNINGTMQFARNTTTDVPEPSVLALFGIGALGIGLGSYRRRKRM